VTRLKITGVYLAALFAVHMLAASSDPKDAVIITSAVDAKGVRHSGSEYRGRPPWLDDYVYGSIMSYPSEERAFFHQGRTVLDLTLDVRTGSVTNIRIIKSSGFPALDESAVKGMAPRRWKPGTWKEIVMPVTFKLSSTPRPPVQFHGDMGHPTGRN